MHVYSCVRARACVLLCDVRRVPRARRAESGLGTLRTTLEQSLDCSDVDEFYFHIWTQSHVVSVCVCVCLYVCVGVCVGASSGATNFQNKITAFF